MNPLLRVVYALAVLVSSCRAGSVLLGGDDLTDHGGYNPATGEVTQGWKYISLAVKQLYVDSTLENHDEVVALIGSHMPDPANFNNGEEYENNAGEGYFRAMEYANLNLEFYDGPEDISAYLQGVEAGTYRPTVIALAGSDAANDIDADENRVVTELIHVIVDYVERGGSVISHGSGTTGHGVKPNNTYDVYEWLEAETGIGHKNRIHGIAGGCEADGAKLTDYGEVLFPNLTNSDIDINAGHCHTNFLPNNITGGYGAFQPFAFDGQDPPQAFMLIARGAVIEHPTVRMDCSHTATLAAGDWTVDLTRAGPDGEQVVFSQMFFVEAGVDGNEFEQRLADALTANPTFTGLGCTAIKVDAFQATCPAGTDTRELRLTFGGETGKVGDEFRVNGLGCPEPNCPICDEAEPTPVCDQRGTVWASECEMNRITCLFPADPLVPTACPTDAPSTTTATTAPTLEPTDPIADPGGITGENTVTTSGGTFGSLTDAGFAGVIVGVIALVSLLVAFGWRRQKRRRAPPPLVMPEEEERDACQNV